MAPSIVEQLVQARREGVAESLQILESFRDCFITNHESWQVMQAAVERVRDLLGTPKPDILKTLSPEELAEYEPLSDDEIRAALREGAEVVGKTRSGKKPGHY